VKTDPGIGLHPAELAGGSLEALRKAAATCHACPLWENATQTVFGEGPANAPLMLVGEQPGDQEDRTGHPFVGPAGQLLARALAEVDISREQVYITNAVKHFKFELRGKRRLHKKPADSEIAACHDWLKHEIELVTPRLVIALGATATRSLLGRTATIRANRAIVLEYGPSISLLVTVHPSFLLRVPEQNKDDEYRRFLADLELAKPFLHHA
jgi:uracil-DNA glycosylase